MDRCDGTRDLVSAMRGLSEIIERENVSLAAQRPGDIRELQAEKDRLVGLCASLGAELKAAPPAADGSEAGPLDEIRTAGQRLKSVMEENQRRLRAAAEANQRLFQSVLDAVRQKRGGNAAYSNSGRVSDHTAATRRPVSLALNETL